MAGQNINEKGSPKISRESVLAIARNIPEATLCSLLTTDRQRTIIIGKMMKVALEIGIMVIANRQKKIRRSQN